MSLYWWVPIVAVVFLALGISSYAIYQFLTGSDHVWHYVTGKGRARKTCAPRP